MRLAKLNKDRLQDERVLLINKVMDNIYDVSNDIYENLIDMDYKLSKHYLKKMIGYCEELIKQTPKLTKDA